MAVGPRRLDSGSVADATAPAARTSLKLRGRTARWLRSVREAAERGDDLGAMLVVLGAVAVFVFSIVGFVTAIGLFLYFTIG
jgi:hypothetical protein